VSDPQSDAELAVAEFLAMRKQILKELSSEALALIPAALEAHKKLKVEKKLEKKP
jgi:hypothetical protein